MLLDSDGMKELFGPFLLLLIGLELVESMQSYLTEQMIHIEVEVMLPITMIAVGPKAIIVREAIC